MPSFPGRPVSSTRWLCHWCFKFLFCSLSINIAPPCDFHNNSRFFRIVIAENYLVYHRKAVDREYSLPFMHAIRACPLRAACGSALRPSMTSERGKWKMSAPGPPLKIQEPVPFGEPEADYGFPRPRSSLHSAWLGAGDKPSRGHASKIYAIDPPPSLLPWSAVIPLCPIVDFFPFDRHMYITIEAVEDHAKVGLL